jgi:hypothetical protein
MKFFGENPVGAKRKKIDRFFITELVVVALWCPPEKSGSP